MKKLKKFLTPKLGFAFLNVFLLMFMLLIFGPAEIFFANETQFDFVYGEFAGYLAIAAVGVTVILSIIMAVLPNILYKLGMSLVLGISVTGYLQVMFFNQQLDLLGLNPEGYIIDKKLAIGNGIIWLVVFAAVVILAFFKEKIWTALTKYVPAFLLCIQLVALVSLFFTAEGSAYHHPEGQVYISGEDQYTVSSKENVILIVLDYFSNQDMLTVQSKHPAVMDCLHDFTFYSNADCNYYGTFPSLPHMLTGQPFDATVPLNQWCADIWNNPESLSFYEQLHEAGYVTNVYTPDLHHLCGTNDASLLQGAFSNIADATGDIDVFYKKLFKTITKMSCYRMAPEFAKNLFYTDGSEYGDIITYEYNTVAHNDDDFYRGLLENGLTLDSESNYLIVQHLLGIHEYTVNRYCEPVEWTTLEETTLGCMVMVEEYLNQLKAAGVYDSSTIIVTSDHGDFVDSQVIYYVKQPGETHDISISNNAPISHTELRPTLAAAAGLDSTQFGQTIYDFAPDELRERKVWVREYHPDYPEVSHYAQNRKSQYNIYRVYTYTGDYSNLLQQIETETYEVVPMTDSFF